MKKIKVLIAGCNCEEAQEVCRQIVESSDLEAIAGFDESAREFPTFPVLENLSDLKDFAEENARPDVIIDFSNPDCTMELLCEFAAPYLIPIVISKGGVFSREQIRTIQDISMVIPVVSSSDFLDALPTNKYLDAIRLAVYKSKTSEGYGLFGVI